METTNTAVKELDIYDFLSTDDVSSHNHYHRRRNDKTKGYRQQVEYGAKNTLSLDVRVQKANKFQQKEMANIDR